MFFDIAVEMIDSRFFCSKQTLPSVFPAKAGIQVFVSSRLPNWMPAFAGMTDIFFA